MRLFRDLRNRSANLLGLLACGFDRPGEAVRLLKSISDNYDQPLLGIQIEQLLSDLIPQSIVRKEGRLMRLTRRLSVEYGPALSEEAVCGLRACISAAAEEVLNAFATTSLPRISIILVPRTEWRQTRQKAFTRFNLLNCKIVVNDVCIRSEPEFFQVTCHEFTHAIVYALAGPTCPYWIHEGIARSIDSILGLRPIPSAPSVEQIKAINLRELDRKYDETCWKGENQEQRQVLRDSTTVAHGIVYQFIRNCGMEALKAHLCLFRKNRDIAILTRSVLEKVEQVKLH